ncbi:hypothetical protein [Pantanalinema sp. GBBB05]|uniref:hypothetical protein n=1 Tax=Pantanalinema sp. GBBB05 TaxID=2604139 RepID=UPI003D813730
MKLSSESSQQIEPEFLDRFFSPEQQRRYVTMLLERGGLTRRRAEYFVRLWAYLLLKQQQDVMGNLQPLTQLQPLEGLVACTHREAAELFYGDQDRGSDRAAGMMIDRLVALGLLDKRFDGQALSLQVRPLPELVVQPVSIATVTLTVDDFNPRTDTIPLANLVTRTYAELIKDNALVSPKIARSFRSWAQRYPKGMRVLRRSDNLNPVGICILYPVTSTSEFNFFQAPSKSFYLTTDNEADPFQMATPGDPDCTSVYIRAWVIENQFLSVNNLCLLLEDTKQTLVQMQADFPNLCDIYSLIVHPLYEELRLKLGFQKTCPDHQRSYHWIYLALDRFLELNISQALASLKLGSEAGASD